MTYHLLLTRPRFEGAAANYIQTYVRTEPHIIDMGMPTPSPAVRAASQLVPLHAKASSVVPSPLNAANSAGAANSAPVANGSDIPPSIVYDVNPADAKNSPRSAGVSVIDICYPTKPDSRNPKNNVALITGYIFVRYADPTHPLPTDILRQSTSNIRYLTIYSHSEPDPASPSHKIDIYVPYTLPDRIVKSLPDTLHQNQCEIIQQLIGEKVRIPSGLCMGMTGKVKKITPYGDSANGHFKDAVVLLQVMHEGVFSKTYLSFTLQELF